VTVWALLDGSGNVISVFANPQTGIAGVVSFADNDPKILAWNTAQANAALCDRVDGFRNSRLSAGFADTGTGGTGKTYACDDSSIGRWTAMAASAQPFAMGIAPQGLTAPTYQPIPTDNSIPSAMTASAIYALFEGRVMPWVAATVIYGRTMKNNILAGNPPADITQGWP
jgi:hypothetical protein